MERPAERGKDRRAVALTEGGVRPVGQVGEQMDRLAARGVAGQVPARTDQGLKTLGRASGLRDAPPGGVALHPAERRSVRGSCSSAARPAENAGKMPCRQDGCQPASCRRPVPSARQALKVPPSDEPGRGLRASRRPTPWRSHPPRPVQQRRQRREESGCCLGMLRPVAQWTDLF